MIRMSPPSFPLRVAFRSLRITRPTQLTRKYATEHSQGQDKKPSDMPKFAGIAAAAGAAYYFFRSGPETKSHHDRDQFNEGDKREASTVAGESVAEPDRDSKQKITASSGRW